MVIITTWNAVVTILARMILCSSLKLAKRQMLLYKLSFIKTTSENNIYSGVNFIQGSRYIQGINEKRRSNLSHKAVKYEKEAAKASNIIRYIVS